LFPGGVNIAILFEVAGIISAFWIHGDRHERHSHAEVQIMNKNTGTARQIRECGTRIAPAVALLLLGDSAYAGIDPDSDDGDFSTVSEPSTLGLLAAGAAVGGIVAYIRSKRRK
jgi:hypothetical protein